MLIAVSEAADWLANAVEGRKLGESKAMGWPWSRTLQHMDSGSAPKRSTVELEQQQ